MIRPLGPRLSLVPSTFSDRSKLASLSLAPRPSLPLLSDRAATNGERRS
jgi:hypothetical protein